jgi:cyanophycinase
VGGHEDKTGPRLILAEIARRIGSGPLVIATLASTEPDRQWATYESAFRKLGIEELVHLDLPSREGAMRPEALTAIDGTRGVFFTGGDQLKITGKLGGTPLLQRILDLHRGGALLAGTSAGAAAMGAVMPVSTEESDTHKIKSAFLMARGLGVVDLVIDQHFAQRARIERLVGAVAENPSALGLGIDEDTAIILDSRHCFEVIGSGAVYVADGHQITYTNVAEHKSDQTLCLFDVRLHVLNHGASFSLVDRRPRHRSGEL